MSTSIQDIEQWLRAGVELKAAYMLVVCDTYNWEDYPKYVMSGEDLAQVAHIYHGPNMQKVMECYDLSKSLEEQLRPRSRVWNGWRPGV